MAWPPFNEDPEDEAAREEGWHPRELAEDEQEVFQELQNENNSNKGAGD